MEIPPSPPVPPSSVEIENGKRECQGNKETSHMRAITRDSETQAVRLKLTISEPGECDWTMIPVPRVRSVRVSGATC